MNTDYLKDSLFDKEAMENKGKKRNYKQGVDHHLTTFSGIVVAIIITRIIIIIINNIIENAYIIFYTK